MTRAAGSTSRRRRPKPASRAVPRPWPRCLGARRFRAGAGIESLRRFAREAPGGLPRRRGLRRAPARKGETVDLRRTLRAAVRQGGDTPVLPWRRRKPRQRRILLLIDISGSMKAHTEGTLRFAHVLYHAAEHMECFTLGTRLTRVTGALRLRNPDTALAKASALAPDWGGGTRARRRAPGLPLGAPFRRLCARRRRRGALGRAGARRPRCDGRRRRTSFQARVAGELAHAARGRPRVPARDHGLAAVVPYLDDLGDGASPDALCRHMLSLGRISGRGRIRGRAAAEGGAPHRPRSGTPRLICSRAESSVVSCWEGGPCP